MVTGIWGEVKVLGTVKIQIPFDEINHFIDVAFLVLDEKVPTLLSLRDMPVNRLEISVQILHVSLGGKTHKL